MTHDTESERGLPELPFDQLPLHAQAVLLADELEGEADRITRYSNSPLDGLFARSASVLRALAAIEKDRAERNFCESCGKRLGDGVHTCTPPAGAQS